MIIIQLIGGLGNQMFQYALGRKMATEEKTDLLVDISAFKNYPLREYSLGSFATTAVIATESQLALFQETTFEKFLNKFGLSKKGYFKKIRNKSGQFDTFIKRDDYGHWNNPIFFSGAEDIIRKEFTLKTMSENYRNALTKIQNLNSVSLHIRRADYLATKNKSVFTECSPEYYKKALEYIAEKNRQPLPSLTNQTPFVIPCRDTGSTRNNDETGLVGDDVTIFVFSDDVAWVKENLKTEYSMEFVSGKGFTDSEELMLMSACKHNITANSTFSWWSAWLNQNPRKIVVTPQKWFVHEEMMNAGFIPETWIRM
jgi:hypothetical protein